MVQNETAIYRNKDQDCENQNAQVYLYVLFSKRQGSDLQLPRSITNKLFKINRGITPWTTQ